MGLYRGPMPISAPRMKQEYLNVVREIPMASIAAVVVADGERAQSGKACTTCPRVPSTQIGKSPGPLLVGRVGGAWEGGDSGSP